MEGMVQVLLGVAIFLGAGLVMILKPEWLLRMRREPPEALSGRVAFGAVTYRQHLRILGAFSLAAALFLILVLAIGRPIE